MKRRKLRSYVVPSFITAVIIAVFFTSAIITNNKNNDLTSLSNINYVTDSIIENNLPVINTTLKMIYPYTDQTVTIGKYYYDYTGSEEQQQKSIIFHDNTYMQNSGIDFVGENVFDVLAVLKGVVNDVKEDETLGNIIEIKHDNDIICIYQSLSEVNVKKGDTVNQGQIIGKSGTNELDKEIGNHLHFELYTNGQVVDPLIYLDKELNKTQE